MRDFPWTPMRPTAGFEPLNAPTTVTLIVLDERLLTVQKGQSWQICWRP